MELPEPKVLTAAVLRERLHYDPETGHFSHAKRTPGHPIGKKAGCPDSQGYIVICVLGKTYKAHRLAFMYMNGTPLDPTLHVDHINGVPGDNRWTNLRAVQMAVNMQNKRNSHKGRSGLLGSHWLKDGKWQAAIGVDGKTRYIGRYDTAEAAHAAYLDAKRRLHAGCTI